MAESPAASASSTEIGKKVVSKRKFDLDTNILVCPICAEPLSTPVFQCRNGHTACSACCKRITGARGCPSCSRPIGVIRNVAIEKVIQSLQVDCKHALHGCNTKLKYTNREQIELHENELCEYRPILCPIQMLPTKCLHIGSKVTLPSHLIREHGIPIVECIRTSARSASFTMAASCPLMLVRNNKTWVMVNCGKAPLTHPGSDVLCRVFEGSKLKVAHKLSVKRIRLRNQEKLFFTFTCMQAQAQIHRYLDMENNSVLDTVGSYRALLIPHEENERSELEFDLKVTFL